METYLFGHTHDLKPVFGYELCARSLAEARRLLHLYCMVSTDPYHYMVRPQHIKNTFTLIKSAEKVRNINEHFKEVGLSWVTEVQHGSSD